jgi:DNA-binding transcriptional regulator of glucitol operon
VTEIPDGLLPERPKPVQRKSDDPSLREYNAYLAELAKADNEGHPRQNRSTA